MYEAVARVYKALGDPIRLQILGLLRVRELCVCELADLLPVSQPAVSQHLHRLRDAGLVRERRQSYWTYYALRDGMADHVQRLIAELPPSEELERVLREGDAAKACAARPLPLRRTP